MLAKRLLLSCAVAAGTTAAHAQVGLDLATSVETYDWVKQLPTGQVRLLTEGVGEAFFDALLAADVQGLLSIENIGDYPIPEADYLLVVRPSWSAAREFWDEAGLSFATEFLPESDFAAPAGQYSVTSTVPAPDGRIVRIETLLSVVPPVVLTPECLAHRVIDGLYRGWDNAQFNAVLCSEQAQ